MPGMGDSAAPPALICIVDDDRQVRTALANLLQSAGYASIAFESAEALLVSERMAGIACAVLDVKLGGMDGFALQGRLRQVAAALPVALMSGHGDETMRQRALDAGAIAFLRKPIDADALLACIGQALGTSGAAP